MTPIGRFTILVAFSIFCFLVAKMPKPDAKPVPEPAYVVAHSQSAVNYYLARGYKLAGNTTSDFLGGFSQPMVK